MDYLETATCGAYQLNQAPGYIEEHYTQGSNYEFRVTSSIEDG